MQASPFFYPIPLFGRAGVVQEEMVRVSELILVRHGQASFGATSYDQLSPVGLQQVEILSRHWLTMGEQFDVCYAGTLQRQQQTASALLPHVKSGEVNIHPALDEYNGESLIRIYLRDHAAREGFAEASGQPVRDRKRFQLILEAATRHWIDGTLVARDEDHDFEPWRDFQRRVHSALDELMHKHQSGSRVLVSTSGGVIALALQHALKLPDNQAVATNWMVNNSSVTRLVYGRGKVSLAGFNALTHLETPALRELITFR
jgi:broad specificity phosphatase PhoE